MRSGIRVDPAFGNPRRSRDSDLPVQRFEEGSAWFDGNHAGIHSKAGVSVPVGLTARSPRRRLTARRLHEGCESAIGTPVTIKKTMHDSAKVYAGGCLCDGWEPIDDLRRLDQVFDLRGDQSARTLTYRGIRPTFADLGPMERSL